MENQKEMTNDEKMKEMVRQKYGEIALEDKGTNACSCCGADGRPTEIEKKIIRLFAKSKIQFIFVTYFF